MRNRSVLVTTLFICLLFFAQTYSQSNDLSFNHSIGFAIGPTFGGPTNQFSRYLARERFDITSPGFIFGPIKYPVKSGPRASYTLNYTTNYKNKGALGFELNLNQLGTVAGQNIAGDRIEVGFSSYTIGVNYIFGSSHTKLSIGPVLMFSEAHTIQLENFEDVNENIKTNIAFALKGQALIYFWNTKSTYGNIGVSYLISYPIAHGPFPLISGAGQNKELEAIKLNFSYGSVFFSFGVKLN